MKKRRRRYVLKARGQALAETRARIVEATMALHEEVGPRHTTISGIAARAGVERLTVYRHFPDEAAVFAACSHRFTELNPPPDPAAWADEPDPIRRTERALRALFAYYSRANRMLDKVYRDVPDYPDLAKIMRGFDDYLHNLADELAAGWKESGARAARTHVLRHAVKFTTWQAFEADAVDDAKKVALLLAWVAVV